jgi:hypothetical protein
MLQRFGSIFVSVSKGGIAFIFRVKLPLLGLLDAEEKNPSKRLQVFTNKTRR